MNSTKLKVWYVKLYALILYIGYGLLIVVAPDLLLELDPSGSTQTLVGIGTFGLLTIIPVGILLYQFNVWGKYTGTILMLFTWIPLSSYVGIYDYIWLGIDIILIYLIWFDKSIARLFK